MKTLLLSSIVASAIAASPLGAVTFDDFNVNEGHFASPPTLSGSNANVGNGSTADRVTTDSPREGTGHQKLVVTAATPGSAIRLRHLSGAGSPANNLAFTTSDGEDGWIGLYVKTTNSDWTVQIWIEGPSNNGSVPKAVEADGEWHLYEWNLDDSSGGADGWGNVGGIVTGDATVQNGSHTIDSVIFRNATGPDSSTLFMDFVAKTTSGSVSNLLTDPCINTSGVLVNGPIATNSNQVMVTSVSGSATQITVYQSTDVSMAPIGTKTNGIVAGTNYVTVTNLVRNARVAATQTVAGQESCVPADGIYVGSGANPSVRIAVSIRETSSTGPAGTPGDTSSTALHFLGASAVSGGAPVDATIYYPSNGWQTVTLQRGVDHSIQWNPSVGNPDNIATPWGILESINFAIADLGEGGAGDTGPFDIYIDDLRNGTNVLTTFEEAIGGTMNYGFRPPDFSGTTVASILSSPQLGLVSNEAADSGTKSFHLRFQWSGTNASKWLRLTTSGSGLPTDGTYPINPQVNLDDPISFRLLMLPAGSTPTPPPAPLLTATKVDTNVVLTWEGAHNLQASSLVTGTYTNVPNVTTNAANPTRPPYTNTFAEPQKFFRLAN